MILYLLLSILSSAFLLIILRSFPIWKVETMHGIIVNYWTAATLAFLANFEENRQNLHLIADFWYVTLMIGFLFIVVFFITARTSQKSGIGAASIASKMSMVIPIGAGILLYNEGLGLQKMAGILLAFPAVILTSRPSRNSENAPFNWKAAGLPALLFVGAGMVDTAIKFAQFHYINDENRQLVIMSIFASAGLFGALRLLFEIFIQKKSVSVKSVLGGLLLGTVNYFSIFFLLKCLESPGTESSTVFALVNVGIVITSFLSGLLLFRESVDRNKIIGLGLALLAIWILSK